VRFQGTSGFVFRHNRVEDCAPHPFRPDVNSAAFVAISADDCT
jgi:hypothetical protein